MKKLFLILALNVTAAGFLNAQYDNPHLDQIPPEFLENISPQSVLAVVTDAGGFDNFNIGTDFGEPHLSMNPNNPLNCFVAYNTNGAHYLLNGHDWSASFSPSFTVATNGDPVTAFDSLGNLYYENMVGGITGTNIIKSINGGVTFGVAVAGNTGNDKNWLAADQTNGPYKNFIYTVMTPGNFKRSINGGASFVNTFSPVNTYPGMMVCVGANGATSGGAVYIVTSTGASQFAVTYNFYCSNDGGATFSFKSSQNYAGYVGTDVGGRHSVQNMRTRPYPMIAADNSYGAFRGRFYLVYATNSPAGNGNKPDIFCRFSLNQGTTWSAPIIVNDNPSPTLSHQFFPAIWCDKTTGRLYCKWFDSRLTPTNDSMDVYASYSDNGGVTWATNQRITTKKAKIDCATCPGGGTPRYQGDYDAIASNSKTSHMAWTDMRAGTFGSYTAYFPDFAMLASPAVQTIHQTNDSRNYNVSVPAVKLFTDVSSFSATVTPAPAAGSISVSFPDGNTLSTYPNSLQMKVRTVGTVTLGNYTINITGQGSNGTPVHKRTVTLTVNTSVGPNICENFSAPTFPPASMFEEFSGTNYWSRNTVSAYGLAGSGSAKFSFFTAPAGTVQSLVSNNFPNAAANTYLTFDNAYAPFTSLGPDTLVIETSANFGVSYLPLVTLLGKVDGTGHLNTAPPQAGAFTPTNSQWRPKIYLLPVGTNKIRLKAKSGFGNNLYIDNICVQVLSVPLSQSISIIQEGFYNTVLNKLNMRDTVRFYLHRTEAGLESVVTDSAISVVDSNTFVAPTTFPRALSGSYYIVVKHRNSILTWSKTGGYIYTRGSIASYNFTTAAAQAFGSNMKLVDTSPSTRYGIYSGDINQDGFIDASDLSLVDNAAFFGLSGYVVEDVTGDRFVDASDLAVTDNNLGIGVEDPLPIPDEEQPVKEFESPQSKEKQETGRKMFQELDQKQNNETQE